MFKAKSIPINSRMNSLGKPVQFKTTRLVTTDFLSRIADESLVNISITETPTTDSNINLTSKDQTYSASQVSEHVPPHARTSSQDPQHSGLEHISQQVQNLNRELDIQEYIARSINIFEVDGKCADLYRSMPPAEAKSIVTRHWDSVKVQIDDLQECILNPDHEVSIHALIQPIHRFIYNQFYIPKVSPPKPQKRKKQNTNDSTESGGSYEERVPGNKRRLADDGELNYRDVTPTENLSCSIGSNEGANTCTQGLPHCSTPRHPNHKRHPRKKTSQQVKQQKVPYTEVSQDLTDPELYKINTLEDHIATIDEHIGNFENAQGRLKQLESDVSGDIEQVKKLQESQEQGTQGTESREIVDSLYQDISSHYNGYNVLTVEETQSAIEELNRVSTTPPNKKSKGKTDEASQLHIQNVKKGVKRVIQQTSDKPITASRRKKGKSSDPSEKEKKPEAKPRSTRIARKPNTKVSEEKPQRPFFIPEPQPDNLFPVIVHPPTDFVHKYKVVPAPSDGHCILHSVVTSVNSQLGRQINLPSLKKAVREEAETNHKKYLITGDPYNKEKYDSDIIRYFNEKIYKSKFCDIVPIICENILKISLHITQKQDNIRYIQILRPQSPHPPVYIKKKNDHYDGLAIKATPTPEPMEVIEIADDCAVPSKSVTVMDTGHEDFRPHLTKTMKKNLKQAAMKTAAYPSKPSALPAVKDNSSLPKPGNKIASTIKKKSPSIDPPASVSTKDNLKAATANNKTPQEAPKHKLPAFHFPRGIEYPEAFLYRISVENPELHGKISTKPTQAVGHILLPSNQIVANRLKAPILFRGQFISLTQVGAEKWKTHTVCIFDIPKWDAFNNTKHIYNHEGVLLVKPVPIAHTANTKKPTYQLIIKYRNKDTVPPFIPINGVKYPTKDSEPVRTRCFKCQKDKHTQATCKSPTYICAFCAGDHRTKICHDKLKKGIPVVYKCANCGGNHPASSPKCKAFQKQPEGSQPSKPLSKKPPALMDLTFSHLAVQRTQEPQQAQAPPSRPPQDQLTFALTLRHTPDNHWAGDLRTTLTLLKYMRKYHPQATLAIDNVAAKLAGAPGREYLRGNALYSAKVKNNLRQAPQSRRGLLPTPKLTGQSQHHG